MSITLKGVVFLQAGHPDYQVGRRAVVTVVINPSASNLTAVDAAKGGAVTVAVPLVSVTYRTERGTVVASTGLPATINVTFGYVQKAYESSGERTISAVIPDYSVASAVHTGNAFVTAFETYGTVFVADIVAVPPADTTSPGTGLQGRYFGNPDLTGTPVFEVVEAPRFEDTEGPHAGVPRLFSARWTGLVKAPSTGKYRFKVRADDGFRLYLDGRLVMDFWSDQNETERLTGYYDYTANQLVKVWLEYFNGSKRGTIEFSWETPGAQFVNVPATALYKTDGTDALPPALAPPNQTRFYAETVSRYQE